MLPQVAQNWCPTVHVDIVFVKQNSWSGQGVPDEYQCANSLDTYLNIN